MERAVVYTRVSTINQETKRQSEDILNYCQWKNLTVVEEFSEKITGASKGNSRPQFKRMIDFIYQNGIKHLIISEISRLGRIHADTANIISDLTEKKVCIHALKESIITLDEHGNKAHGVTLLLAIFGGVAEMELETIRYRVRSGLDSSRKNGGGQSGMGAYGFMNIKKKLALNPDEVPYVKLIFDLYLQGKGSYQIAKHFNQNNIPTKSKSRKWNEVVVHNILRNPIYKGKRRHNDMLLDLPNELIIIPPAKFDQAQMMLTANFNKSDVNRKYINVLSGKLKCSCGQGMFMHRRPIERDKNHRKDNTYKCMSKRYTYRGLKNNCSSIGINIDLLNSLLAYHVNQQTSDSVFKSRSAEIEIEIDRKYKLLMVVEKKVDKIIDLYQDGFISRETFNTKYNKIQAEIELIGIDINDLKDEYDKAIAQQMQSRYFDSKGKLRNKPISSEKALVANQLKEKVSKQVKEVLIRSLPVDANMEYRKSKLDNIHMVSITGYDNVNKIYYVSSWSKLVHFDGKVVLNTPKPIYI